MAKTPPTTTQPQQQPQSQPQQQPAAPTTPQPAPRLVVSCHKHRNHTWGCVVSKGNSAKSNFVGRCNYHKKPTAKQRNACRQKWLHRLGFFKAPVAKAANAVDASYNTPGMLCPREPDSNPNGDFTVFSPYIEPRDRAQNGLVGITNAAYWWDGSQWVYWTSTPLQFHYKPSDIFEQALDVHKFDWYDSNLKQSLGDWTFTAPKGTWAMVYTYYVWFPQNGFPDLVWDVLPANQDSFGVSVRGRLCNVGYDDFGDYVYP